MTKKATQETLFDIPEDWREEWEGMPEYEHNDIKEHQKLIESTIIKYLKQENLYSELLQEEGDIVGYIPLQDEPINSCFGIDCYEVGSKLVEEKEYPKYKV